MAVSTKGFTQDGIGHREYLQLPDGSYAEKMAVMLFNPGTQAPTGYSTSGFQVDILTLGSSSTKTTVTGTQAIAASHAISARSVLDHITAHFSGAPTTSENFTITLNAIDGSAYDTVISKVDPYPAAVTDIFYKPESPVRLFAGDSVDVAFSNTGRRTYGVRIVSVPI